ncbi:MAG: hypothetical protein SGILL_005659 [Bacillariaceae sp.]
MIKHMSGLLASASIAAKAVPRIGLSQARKWIEQVVQEPVAQYVFYSALLLLWSPKELSAVWWWPQHGWIVPLLVGPILLREMVSILLVFSDVIVLCSVGDADMAGMLRRIVDVARSVVDGVMSLLVGATKWKAADSTQRQAILASLVSKISLAFEAGVGAFLLLDSLLGILPGVGSQRPSWKELGTKLAVVRLYMYFLLSTRKKGLSEIGTQVRGGAAKLPFWILDALHDPTKALGVEKSNSDLEGNGTRGMGLGEALQVGMGLHA